MEENVLVQTLENTFTLVVGKTTDLLNLGLSLYDFQEFDKKYGGGWQCVVGSSFGCFFTHSKGTFIYFTVETLNFLIFKGASS